MCNFIFECMANEHATQPKLKQLKRPIRLLEAVSLLFFFFSFVSTLWIVWIVCYFVIFNTCSRTTDKRNKFHWGFFFLIYYFYYYLLTLVWLLGLHLAAHWLQMSISKKADFVKSITVNSQNDQHCEIRMRKNYNSRARIASDQKRF